MKLVSLTVVCFLASATARGECVVVMPENSYVVIADTVYRAIDAQRVSPGTPEWDCYQAHLSAGHSAKMNVVPPDFIPAPQSIRRELTK